MIVGIYSSVPQSGKSTVSKAFVEAGFTHLSFATPVKMSMAVVLNGLGVENGHDYLFGDKKDMDIPFLGVTGGHLLSTFATDYMRNQIYEDVWLDIAKNMIEDGKDYVVDDMRFENEFNWIQEDGLVIHVKRPGFASHTRSVMSEGLLDNHDFDAIITNDGTEEELKETSKRMVGIATKMLNLMRSELA